MKSAVCCISLLFLTCACLPLQGGMSSRQVPAEDPAMRLFAEGIDHFDPAQRNEAFLALGQQHPESAWNERARVVANLAGSMRLLEKQVKRQEKVIKAQENDHQRLTELQKQNELLLEQVRVLKALIVDLELRQP